MAALSGAAAPAREQLRRLPAMAENVAVRPGRALWRLPPVLMSGLILLTVGVFGLLQVMQTSDLATAGFELNQLHAERAALVSEIRLSEAELAGKLRLDWVRDQAVTRLGMVEPEQQMRISVNRPAPVLTPLPRRYVSPIEPIEAGPAAWWEPLVERLPTIK